MLAEYTAPTDGVQAGSTGTRTLRPEVKWPGRKADHPTAPTVSVNTWIYTSTLPHACMAWLI